MLAYVIELSALSYLPCGCVVDLQAIAIEADVATCPWCDISFSALEFTSWYREQSRPLVTPQAPLVLEGDRALVVVGQCGCGSPVVRERVRGAVPEHCEKPFEVLKD